MSVTATVVEAKSGGGRGSSDGGGGGVIGRCSGGAGG